MTQRKRNVVVASGLALLALVFMLIYISQARSSSDENLKKSVAVLIASHDITAGTLGSSLATGALVEKRIPQSVAVPESIKTPAAVRGQIVTQDILSGEQVTLRKFGPLQAAGVRVRIHGRDRVVQLTGDKDQVLDGTLKAGDHVDFVATWNTPENCGTCHVSRTIVRDALVLATSAELGGAGSAKPPVQLRLTDAQAERVFWMTRNGEWALVVRPVVKPRSSHQGFDNARTILSSSLVRTGPSR